MDFSGIFDVNLFFSILRDRLTRGFTLATLIVSIFASYFVGVSAGLLIILSYSLGVICFSVIFTKRSYFNLHHFFNNVLNEEYSIVKFRQHYTGCNICSDVNCKRQKPVRDTAPWQGLLIPKEIDQALQDLYNKILNEFITDWYSSFTKDENCLYELRKCLRFATAVFLRKVLEVNVIDVICDRLITTGFSHVNDFVNIREISKVREISVEEAAVEYLGTRLHPAVKDRKTELNYLRGLTVKLQEHLMNEKNLKCQSFSMLVRELLSGWVLLQISDTISDPQIINTLLMLALSNEPLTKYANTRLQFDEILRKFVTSPKNASSKKSPLYNSVQTILKDQHLLYTFQQFLKKENSINVLQFVLSVEEFSKKMLPADIDKSDLQSLHKDAWDLFTLYFNQNSPDSLHFSDHIVRQMEEVLEAGVENVTKLRTSKPLFQAYEEAYTVLEETWCPLFHQSDDYFNMMCGPRANTGFSKQALRANKKSSDGGTMSKIKVKLQKVLQTQPVAVGSPFSADEPLDFAGTAEDEDLENFEDTHSPRNLSTWTVSIPSVKIEQNLNSKPYALFRIHVLKKEGENFIESEVFRKQHDFYILHAKLVEFHAEYNIEIPDLPHKKCASQMGEYAEGRRKEFEEFLQKLLKITTLQQSSLLYTFLSESGEFSNSITETDGFGKLLKRSVQPIKLRKERGQHLDKFLADFLASTDGQKKTNQHEYQDINFEPPRKIRCLTNTIYCNNFEPYLKGFDAPRPCCGPLLLSGPWDCIIFTLVKLMNISLRVLQLVVSIKSLFGSASDLLLKKYLDRALRRVLVPARIAHLVRLLQGALFSPKQPEKTNLSSQVEEHIQQLKLNIFISLLIPNFHGGLKTIFDCLQYPLLNKHLCYRLLDEIAASLYPELLTI